MKNRSYSIVLTVYNDETEIKKLLDEITQQTLKPQQVIIVDGGPTDNTINLISQYRINLNTDIVLICEKRKNISEGLNIAIKHATSDYVGIVATGNDYSPSVFEELFATMNEQELCDIVYPLLADIESSKFSKVYNDLFLNHNRGPDIGMASNHCVLVKRMVFEKEGYFYENFYHAGEDEEYFGKLLRRGYKQICCKNEIVLWSTPKTIKEYLKQLRVYTIGKIQIYSNNLLCIPIPWLMKIIVIFMDAFIVVLYGFIRKIKIKAIFLLVISMILPTYYMIANMQFLRIEKKVFSS